MPRVVPDTAAAPDVPWTASRPPWGLAHEPSERRFIGRWRDLVTRLQETTARREEWVRFIKELDLRVGGFDWFSTLTFRDPTHPESAVKAFMRWTHAMNRKIYGVRYTQRPEDGISSVLALEYQRRGVIHFHALQGGTKARPGRQLAETAKPAFVLTDRHERAFRRLTAMDAWFQMAGIARIYPYRRDGGAEKYVAKYITKAGGGDIFLAGPFGARTPELLPGQ